MREQVFINKFYNDEEFKKNILKYMLVNDEEMLRMSIMIETIEKIIYFIPPIRFLYNFFHLRIQKHYDKLLRNRTLNLDLIKTPKIIKP